MTATSKLMTGEELLALPDDGRRHELLDGVLITMSPTGETHGWLELAFGRALGNHVIPGDLGRVMTGEPGIFLRRNPDRVRAPDVCFTVKERMRPRGARGYTDVVPDLIVEIVSPGDRTAEVLAKVAEWLQARARLVWLVYPNDELVVAYTATEMRVFHIGDTLDGAPVLPDFQVSMAELFA